MIKGHALTRQVFMADGIELEPGYSLTVRNHSPDGFSWGYGGSGPAQLALALMLVFLPRHCAVKLYQDFKNEVIAKFPQDQDFDLASDDIRIWIKNKMVDMQLTLPTENHEDG
jgi:hypothetical protein